MRKVSVLMCVFMLLSLATAFSEENGETILGFMYEGEHENLAALRQAISYPDLLIENEYGAFRITEVYFTNNVLRYLFTATPQDQAIRFVGNDWPLEGEVLGEDTYEVVCIPGGVNALSHGYEASNRYRDEHLYTCYTFVDTDMPGEAKPLHLDLWILDSQNKIVCADAFEITLEDADIGKTFSFAIDEWIGGIWAEKIVISRSPADFLGILYFSDTAPLAEKTDLKLFFDMDEWLPDDPRGGGEMGPSDGYSYWMTPAPGDELLSLETLIIKHGREALVLTPEQGSKEWMSHREAMENSVEQFYVIIRTN